MLKRNVVANFLGQFVGVAVGIVFVPLYVRYLGVEAFGVVGFFAMLQGWLALLDLGLSPTLVREMARLRGGAHTPESARDLLRSLEIIGIVLATAVAAFVFLLAPVIAGDWLRPERLAVDEIVASIRVMALVSGLRVIESLHRSALLGLERQVGANLASCSVSLFRSVGALLVLRWLSPSLMAFFYWQLATSFVSTGLFCLFAYKSLPTASRRSSFSRSALGSVRSYAAQMTLSALVGLLLTQVDKLMLSRQLSLDEYGTYVLATTAAGGITMLVGPITQAFFPRLCQNYASEDAGDFARVLHLGSTLVSVFAGTAGIVLAIRAEGLMFAWTGNADIAEELAPLVAVLSIGNIINAVLWMPYQGQLARGDVKFGLLVNIVAICLIVPAMLWSVPIWGSVGAAWVWLCLNLAFFVFVSPFAVRRCVSGQYLRWLVADVAVPLAVATCTILSLGEIVPTFGSSRVAVLAECAAQALGAMICVSLLSADLRSIVKPAIMRRFVRQSS
jgi:O-antigen/teichoic acid export membrane protein